MLSRKEVPLSILLLVFLFSKSLMGQNDYHEGYVVTNANDTLYGKIKNRDTGAFGKIYEKIRFKGKRKKRYAPKDIKFYKMGNDLYRSLYLDGRSTFLKVGTEGYINHYIYEFQEQGEQLVQDVDYLQRGSNGALVRADQGLFGLKKKRLARMFSDCPELAEKILNKKIKYAFEVADFYNTWKAQQ